MKIYIVKELIDYEGYNILGIFDNKEQAIELFDSTSPCSFSSISLDETTLNEVPYNEKNLNFKG